MDCPAAAKTTERASDAASAAAVAVAVAADGAAAAPCCFTGQQLPPSVKSYQLIVSFHEACYQKEFPAADLSEYVYQAAKVDQIYVKQQQQQQQQQQQGPPPPPPPPPRLQGSQKLPPPPPPLGGSGWRPHPHSKWQRPPNSGAQGGWQQRPPWQRHQGGRGFRRAEDEVKDELLEVAHASTSNFEVCLDRRLRPVLLAVHKKAACALPHIAGDIGAATTTTTTTTARGELREVQQLAQALQGMVNVIYSNRMSPLAFSSDGGDGGGGSDAPDGGSVGPNSGNSNDDGGGGGRGPGGNGGSLPPPAPPLIVLANEGDWRDSRRIHLKAPIPGAADYLRLLRELLANGGFVMKNHDDDSPALEAVLRTHHANLTANYSKPYLQPFISNFMRLGTVEEVLESQPELFFRVPHETGQLAGGAGLGAVWYGCRRLPWLVASLPGRPVNGLSLAEALHCMGAFWESELRRRLFDAPAGVVKAAGLTWVLVPCFA
ncbi:hypothetical protein PLESTF_001734400 [Pleodorina starrii]|nr:hypothetical protein PLESTM_000425500 [Pleodorina starrii]GLC76100.1 hypothetical protein PLESTF_001734400 [Pleodorina starrii]